jgi:hypothetical protein
MRIECAPDSINGSIVAPAARSDLPPSQSLPKPQPSINRSILAKSRRPATRRLGAKISKLPVHATGQEFQMSKKIYVGNLPFSATEEQIQQMFAAHGTVESVALITDRETGRPRGFGFVEMSSGASEAIQALNEKDMDGRNLKVNEARPREDRKPRW